jgi:NADH-quinone oxidoreductase subunit H
METSFIIYKLILVLAVFGISLLIAMYSTYAERKVAAFMQDRIGPNRAGPFGILQPLADGVKMFMKEEIIPNVSNRMLFIIGTMHRNAYCMYDRRGYTLGRHP